MATRHNGGADELIDRLNRALSLEYAATIQYLQQQCAVKGKERQQFAPFFAASSGESHLHAQNLGNKIAALGGVPTSSLPKSARERTSRRCSGTIWIWSARRWTLTSKRGNWLGAITRWLFWLEEIISEEQLHVDELEKLNAAYA